MADLHFLRPYWLLALIPLAVVLVTLVRKRGHAGVWERVCDPALLPFIIRPGRSVNSPLRLMWLGLAGLLAILALAGPAWKKIPQPVFSDSNALIVALDLSLSMDATDVTPSRLERARFELQDLLAARDAGRGETGLLVYAGDAFTVTPLTDDTDTIANLLKAVGSDLMPSPGSNTIKALDLAERLLADTSPGNSHILLVTDGAEFDTEKTVRALRAKGIRTSVLVMGTDQGGPIPTGNGFVTGRDGKIIIPSVDLNRLSRIAEDGGGLLIRGQSPGNDIPRLVHWLEDQAELQAGHSRELEADLWREEGPWLLLLLIPLAAMSFRRGLITAVMVVMLFPTPRASADEGSLWRTPDQQATILLDNGDAAGAAKMFRQPGWKAVADYRNGDFAAAASALKGLDDPTSQYNRGNALARSGDFQGAIDAYTRALELNPRDDDARYNRELIQQLAQNGQQDKKDGEQAGEEGDSGQQDGQSQDPQSAQNQDGQQSGQQKGEKGESESEPGEQQASQGEQQGQQLPADQMGENARMESAQATEQWLRRIPDDPGGLLRRKFYYQYQQGPREPVNRDEEFW